MKKVLFLLMFPVFISGQIETPEIISIQQKIDALERTKEILKTELEAAKLNWIQAQIKKIGVPSSGNSEEVIDHLAFSLSYNEHHEQANWVMHVILPAISDGNAMRSNDFREDTLVTTGTSLEQDYFLKEKKPSLKKI
jgi:endonuclease G